MAVKAKVSDFEDKYKAYAVVTDNGSAYKGPDYDRAVDIGGPRSYAMTTGDIQALYGDTVALQLRKPGGWPANPQIVERPVKLVSLSLSFNQASKLMEEQAKTGQDLVAQAFEKAVQKHRLEPLGEFFIIPTSLLPDTPGEKETVRAATQNETKQHIENHIHQTILTVESADRLLSGVHAVAMLIEAKQPGFIGKNRFIMAGLYLGDTGGAVKNLPLPEQNNAPITQITSELRRLAGPK